MSGTDIRELVFHSLKDPFISHVVAAYRYLGELNLSRFLGRDLEQYENEV